MLVRKIRVRKGSRVGAAALTILNPFTEVAPSAKIYEKLIEIANKAPYKKSMIEVSRIEGEVVYKELYPGDAQVIKTLENKSLDQLNAVRARFGLNKTDSKSFLGVLSSIN